MLLEALKNIVGDFYVDPGESAPAYYRKDESFGSDCDFDLLIKPGSVEELSEVLRTCYRHNIPVTVRGGGTGVTGGALPVRGGILISMERLNRVLSVDKKNRFAVVEAGVITKDFCDAVEKEGMYFPVTPGSMSRSFIGGNIAENAAGIKSCKYGTFVDHVLNLEVVLASGEIIQTGANVHKNATGFNLTKLFVGSEGVLGVVSKAVLKIMPKPAFRSTLMMSFSSLQDACGMVLKASSIYPCPCAVELVTKEAIRVAMPYLPSDFPLVAYCPEALLIVEWEEHEECGIASAIASATKMAKTFDACQMIMTDEPQEIEKFWLVRNVISRAMTENNWIYRDIDSCVPPAELYGYLQRLEEIRNRYSVPLVCFGHAMEGNIHSMLLIPKSHQQEAGTTSELVLQEIYKTVVALGGAISGEHGIGSLQQPYLPIQFDPFMLDLMRRIKLVFDPAGTLNPGKLLLDID
ncbi:MAG TPA: FAD-linked oxidase C-terminal domain-containing protein [Puia sp.]|nr:FAD-linked oxidase C-terminal domain-containing protein [Puia sp.]